MTADNTKVYIGDAVYADYDGLAIILTTEDGRDETNRIVLEPREWKKLSEYVQGLKTAIKTATKLGLEAIEALKEETARGPDPCSNPSCVHGLAPRKTGSDEGDVDMEPCPACGGPGAS